MNALHRMPHRSLRWLASGLVLTTLFSCSLFGQSPIHGWGIDNRGQISGIPSGGSFIQVAAGEQHGLALTSDGSIEAWGRDNEGQVSSTPSGNGFTMVAGGRLHSLALRSDGSIQSWGGDPHGQISNTPTGSGFTRIAAGAWHSLALHADGSIVCWGGDISDIGGFGGQVSQSPAGTGFIHVGAGRTSSFALRSDGSIVAWGYDNYSVVSGIPTGTGFVDVSAGAVHAMAQRADGSLVSWGSNSCNVVTFTPFGPGPTHAAVGMAHSAAILANGSVASWGCEQWSGVVSDTPPGGGFSSLSAGAQFTLALRNTDGGNSFCYGDETGWLCPCGAYGNAGQGCANSSGTHGASLEAFGQAQLSNDSFRLVVSGVPGSKPGLILQGKNQLFNALGVRTGDGLLCVGGNSLRSQVQMTVAGATTFTDFQGSGFGASAYGLAIPTNYQFWYRDLQNSCSGAGFNFSNAWMVTWTP